MTALPTAVAQGDLTIRTEALTKRYGDVAALRDVALQVPTGAVFLLVGPNGAGKSTTIRILLDLLRPTSGTAQVFGLDARRDATRVRANVGYVPEQLEWGYGWMRVGRLLEHHARYFPAWDAAYARHLTKVFQLRPEQRMRTLSKGQGRRVHLVLALAHRPPLLILDEPTDGLDPVMRDETLAVLVDHLATAPTTLLLCTHHVAEFEQVADHIGVLRDGQLRAQLPLHDLRHGLRRYRGAVPARWSGDRLFGDAAIRRTTTRDDMDWIVWGEEHDVVRELAAAGAVVRDTETLTLHEATLALLTAREGGR